MPKLFIEVPPIGIGPEDNFFYDGTRPAQHCRICGESYQPSLARSPEYQTNLEVRLQVQQLLIEWSNWHNNHRHSAKEHKQFRERGIFMTPEAALKLVPLGIYPLADLVSDEEVAQAGLEAKRAPSDDVRNRR